MIVLLILILCFPLSAQALQPDDFARGFQLEINSTNTLQKLELPWEVYAASARADLGDLRIFNAKGEEIPLHLQRVAPELVSMDDVVLPMFRIGGFGKGKKEYDLRMQVRTSDQGAVLDTRIKQASGSSEQVMLLDASKNNRSMSALRFELTADIPMTTVTIQGSDDLFSWKYVGNGVLARMGDQSARIVQDRIGISEHPWHYYLITAQGDLAMLGKAFGVTAQGLGPEARRWAALSGKNVETNVVEYQIPRALPVDLLDLDGNQTVMLGVTVAVPAADKSWRALFSGSLYRIPQGDRMLSGLPVHFNIRSETFRITFHGIVAPLRVGWIAHELIFMPQGQGPFLLTAGKADVPVRPDVLGPMLDSPSLKDVHPGLVRIVHTQELPGAHSPEAPRDMKKYVLWIVLGVGVVLLGGMAWNLVRSLKPREEQDKS